METEVTGGEVSNETCRWRKREPAVVTCKFLGLNFSDINEVLTPFQYFKQFFDDELIEFISAQTNIYCIQQKVEKNLNCKLLETDKNEIEQFIGILLFMGIYPLPQYRMYWNPKYNLPHIAQALQGGVNIFEILKGFLHFSDNSKLPVRNSSLYDILYRIRPILDSVVSKCQRLEPEEYHSLDEKIISTKCHSSLKQYNPRKPHKWGFKVFSRCGVSGIIYEFEVYTEKKF